MSNNPNKDYTQLHIHASKHPKAYAPHILILNIVMSVLGAIIGLELIVRTGVAPNTSIVGALFAIIISRIPIAILKKYQSIHCQNLIQTSISGATFSAANCFLLPIGVPVIMGRMDLMYPMLIGAFLATIIDATILYKTFDSEMFPAEGAWPPGVASAESILAVVQKGKKALLLLAGMGIGIGGKMIGIPTDLLGVSWFGDFAAMAALGVGSIVIGIIKTNGFIIDIFGTSLPVITDLFGEGAALMAQPMFQYMPHGIMIGAGLISLIQCGRMLLKKSDGNSAAGKFSSSMANMKKALGGGYVAYLIVAVLLAIWVGVAKDEKDGDRESLYENVDYGLGFWMPQGYTENPFYISDMETDGNGLMVEFFAPEADMQIFSFWYLDKAYWENEVKESYSGMYRQVYADEERVLLCVFVTDVQYDPENREKKKEYEKLHDLQDEMCDSYYLFDVPERGEPVGEMPQFDIPEGDAHITAAVAVHDGKGYALTKEEYLFLENGGDVEEMLKEREK